MRNIVLVRFLLSSFLAFFSGNLINFSIVLYSQEKLDSAILSGIGYALVFGPSLIFGWFAGVICDRNNAIRIIVPFQLGVVALVLVMSYLTTINSVWVVKSSLIFISFLIGIAWSFLGPARFTMVSRITDAKTAKISTSLMSTFVMVAMGAAPLVVTTVSYNMGWKAVFYLIATLLVVSLILLKGIKEIIPLRISERTPWFVDVKSVVSHIIHHNKIILYFYSVGLAMFFLLGAVQILVPLHIDATLLLIGFDKGVVISTTAVGLIVGNFIAIKNVDKPLGFQATLVCTLLAIVFLGLIVFSSHMFASMTVIFISAGLIGFSTNLAISNIQSNSNAEFKGRIISLYTICTQIGPALGALFASFFFGSWGVNTGLVLTLLIPLVFSTVVIIKSVFLVSQSHKSNLY